MMRIHVGDGAHIIRVRQNLEGRGYVELLRVVMCGETGQSYYTEVVKKVQIDDEALKQFFLGQLGGIEE